MRSQITQRLYEFLKVKLYGVVQQGGKFYHIQYRDLCQLMPLAAQKKPRYAKYQLKKAHEELVERNYLEKVEWDGWVINYYPGEEFFKEYQESKGAETPFRLSRPRDEEREARIEALVQELKRELGFAERNLNFYYYIARRVPEDLIRACLRDVKDLERAGRVEMSKVQLFTAYLKESCASRNIPLEFKRKERE